MENQQQFVERISLEEYEKQKKDHTQNALKTLQQQMKTYQRPKVNITMDNSDVFNVNSDNDDNDYTDNDYSDNDDNCEDVKITTKKVGNVNVIFKHISSDNNEIKGAKSIKSPNEKKTDDSKKGAKSINTGKQPNNISNVINDAIYGQHEIDRQKIQKLENFIQKLKRELDGENNINHYLKLDLNNLQIDNDTLNTEIKYLRKVNEELKKENITHITKINHNSMIIILLAIIILILIILLFL